MLLEEDAAKKTTGLQLVEEAVEKSEDKESAPVNNKATPTPARRSRQPATGKQHKVDENVGDLETVTEKDCLLTDQMRQVLNDMSAAEVKAWISAGDGIRKEMENKPGFLLTLRPDKAEAVGDQMAAAPVPEVPP